jgi:hypothetical protein
MEACVIYDLKTTPVPNAGTCEWYTLRDGKIASITAMFDARPFAPLFEGEALRGAERWMASLRP